MKSILKDTTANVPALVVGAVAFLIATIVGLMLWYKIDAALAGATTFTTLPTGARAAWNSTNTTANSTWTLAPIVALVLIAGIIIATIIMFAGGRQGA
jgi:hypothetical protein